MATSEDYPIQPVDQWVQDLSVGSRLHDPINGEPVDSSMPPAYMRQHPRLRIGFDYMINIPPDFKLHIAYSSDQQEASDLGAPGGFEQIVSDAGDEIQAVGHTVDGTTMAVDGNDLSLQIGPALYLRRIQSAAQDAGLPTFGAGLALDSSNQPHTSLERAMQAVDDITKLSRYDERRRRIDPNVLDIVSDNMRQWYRVLSAGERMQRLDRQRQELGSTGLSGVLLVVPIADVDFSRKCSVLGQVEPHLYAADPTNYDTTVALRAHIMRSGAV